MSFKPPLSVCCWLTVETRKRTAAQTAPTPTPELVDIEYVFVGGITDLDGVEFVQVEADASVPELPVEYEAEAAGPEGGAQ